MTRGGGIRSCFRVLAWTVSALFVLLGGGGDLLAQAGGGRPLAPAVTPPGIELHRGVGLLRFGTQQILEKAVQMLSPALEGFQATPDTEYA